MFRELLSEEARQSLDAMERECARLHRLTDQWLAAALLKLARQAQADMPDLGQHGHTYDSRLIWSLIPEVSRRLGTVRLLPAEFDLEIRPLSDYELRIRVGNTLYNVGRAQSAAWKLLTRDCANGNPTAMAVDRLCPGVLGDRDDPLVKRLTEVAFHRKVPFHGVWAPSFGRHGD